MMEAWTKAWSAEESHIEESWKRKNLLGLADNINMGARELKREELRMSQASNMAIRCH